MNLNGQHSGVRNYEDRFRLLYIAITICALIVLSRLWFLQIIKGDELKAYSDKNRVKETKIVAARGLILDRYGRVLVENLPGFESTITPQYATQLEIVTKEVSPILNIPENNILKTVLKSKRENGLYRPVKIKENLTLDEVYKVKLAALHNPGLRINATIVRHYPMGENGAQLFGYVGEISKKQISSFKREYPSLQFEQGDIIGKSGLEEVWEKHIRGENGIEFNEVDARGRGQKQQSDSKSFLGLTQKEAKPGRNLILTIDKDIQQAAYKAMNRQDKIGLRVGALVVLKNNGEVLAWVNTPSFDPNKFSTGISKDLWRSLLNDPNKPLRNKVIQDHYPPGSLFKPIVALAALQENIVTPSTKVYSPGFWKFGSRRYHDHTRYGHGNINILDAIERSSNIFFYKMGDKLGINNISKYSKLLGLGAKTNINLENEQPGLIPTEEWKEKRFGEPWQPGENLSNAIGQGFILATPLQMAVTYNAIGNEGLLYKPFIVKKVIDNNNNILQEFEPQLVRDLTVPNEQETFISKENFKLVKEGMRRVVYGDHGTARGKRIREIQYAGKTGTAQIQTFSADQIYDKCSKRAVERRHHGWFGAFAPAKKPEITIIVLAEHACSGSAGGAPVARDVIRAYFKKYHPEKFKKKTKLKSLAKTKS